MNHVINSNYIIAIAFLWKWMNNIPWIPLFIFIKVFFFWKFGYLGFKNQLSSLFPVNPFKQLVRFYKLFFFFFFFFLYYNNNIHSSSDINGSIIITRLKIEIVISWSRGALIVIIGIESNSNLINDNYFIC